MRLFLAVIFAFAGLLSGRATIHIVAAENFYGGVAQQIGGDQVQVTSILTNPDQDPHLFTVDPRTAAAVEQADIVVVSGIDYDPWMADLVKAHPNPKRTVITVADIIGAKEGENPHIWYKFGTMSQYSQILTNALCRLDPDHASEYIKRFVDLGTELGKVSQRSTEMFGEVEGIDVLATEPVFGYMAHQLGLKMHGEEFQNHVMNNVEPTAQETEEFEDLLRQHKVKLLFYNSQASDPIADRMKDIAKTAGIPVVGVTETEPANTTYVSWMLAQLDEVEKALAK